MISGDCYTCPLQIVYKKLLKKTGNSKEKSEECASCFHLLAQQRFFGYVLGCFWSKDTFRDHRFILSFDIYSKFSINTNHVIYGFSFETCLFFSYFKFTESVDRGSFLYSVYFFFQYKIEYWNA